MVRLLAILLSTLCFCSGQNITPPPVYGPHNAKVQTNAPVMVKLREFRNRPALFSFPTNFSKQGWERFSSSDMGAGPIWLRVVSGNAPDGRWGVPSPESPYAQIYPVTVQRGQLVNFRLYEMGIAWNLADTYSEFDPVAWQYNTRLNMGRLVTNREVDMVSFPFATVTVSTGWHRIEVTTNLQSWSLVETVLGPTNRDFDIDERKSLCLWRATKVNP